ncbi:MAG TPA: type II secretion system minor pseudopilin GspK [Patescibacteria group bacterium]|nr:type II secretion system minor pseudopilin GspK [Patescibacteria group bacterium]
MKRERGVALIVAVLLVALATLIVASLIDTTDLALARTRNLVREQQANAYARGLETWALDWLRRDQNEEPGIDSNNDVWARPLPPLDVPGGRLSGRLRERNGCFNLNQLVVNGNADAVARRRFERLLRALKLSPELADAVIDYADADNESGARGAEDMAYLLARPPRRAANQSFAHVSELRLVRGIDEAVYRVLEPQVCANPDASAINVNTATPQVLMSLVDNLDEAQARKLNDEGRARMASVEAFEAKLAQFGWVLDGGPVGIGVASDQFLAEAVVELDGIPFRYYSRIEREPRGHRVSGRSRGVD